MTSLYSLRSTPSPGEFTITKFDEDYSVESLYALSQSTCTCPQGHKPKCKHRRMLPLFTAHGHVDDGWFLDWDTRMWRHPLAMPDAPAPLADTTILGDAEHAEEIAKRMAPAFASEGSNTVLSREARSLASNEPTISKPQAIPPGTNNESEVMPTDGRSHTTTIAETRPQPPTPTVAGAGELRRRRI